MGLIPWRFFTLNGSAVYLKDCLFKIIIGAAYLTSLKNFGEMGSLDLALYFSLLDGISADLFAMKVPKKPDAISSLSEKNAIPIDDSTINH